jgi:hypothetical protein
VSFYTVASDGTLTLNSAIATSPGAGNTDLLTGEDSQLDSPSARRFDRRRRATVRSALRAQHHRLADWHYRIAATN